MPLAFGYKISLGNRWIFRPTLGPTVGYAFSSDHYDYDNAFIAGPALGLNFESTHFSVGLQGLYSVTEVKGNDYWRDDYNYTGAYLTLGYKF